MDPVSITVRADWDDEAHVWVATSDDIRGLALEAESLEALTKKIEGALSDLLELNGLEGVDTAVREVPVRIQANQTTHILNPSFA